MIKLLHKALQKDPWLKWLIPLFVTLSFILFFFGTAKPPEQKSIDPVDVSTLIPDGFVLVPVELTNAEVISSLLGDYGIADLYETSTGNLKGRKIASGLRLMRAPLNPQMFGVLVPEASAERVVSAQGPLIAVLQNRNSRGFGKINHPQRGTPRVEYYE